MKWRRKETISIVRPKYIKELGFFSVASKRHIAKKLTDYNRQNYFTLTWYGGSLSYYVKPSNVNFTM